MTTENEWQDWSRAWKASDTPPSSLLERVGRDRRRQQFNFAMEIVACVVLVAFYGTLLAYGAPRPIQALAVANFVFVAVWLTRFFWQFRQSWSAEATTTRAFLELTLSRLTAQLRWNAFVRRCLVVLGLGGAAWMVWMISAFAPVYRAEPWRAVGGVLAFTIIIVGLALYTRRQKRLIEREIATMRGLLEQ